MNCSKLTRNPLRRRLLTGAVALLAGTVGLAAHAAVYQVTKVADTADGACDRDCSLREAVIAANGGAGGATILLPAGHYAFTRAGAGEDAAASGDLDILGEVTIVGEGADKSTIDATAKDRVFDLLGDARLDLLGIQLTGGAVSGNGGALRVGNAAGHASLTRVEIGGNDATGAGGALWVAGTVEIAASTLEGNHAGGNGGGIEIPEGGSVTLINSTLHANIAGGSGGGLHTAKGEASLHNVTVVRNQAAVEGGGVAGDSHPFQGGSEPTLEHTVVALNLAAANPDCAGIANSGGYNLLGDAGECNAFTATGDQTGNATTPLDPAVGLLAGNGGPTLTVVPAAGSPLIDAGDATCTVDDQRGIDRPVGSACDIGAVEVTDACIDGDTTLCLNDGRFAVEVDYATPSSGSGAGHGDKLSNESGTFWFFAADNREIFIKVLDACHDFDRYWVFVSGLTNVDVAVTVTDTVTGEVNTYSNPQGTSFEPRLDTDAFATCN
jgi:CSLREA domain-containing protein